MKFKHKLIIGLFVLITIALIFYFIFIPIYLNDYSSAITDLLKNNTIKSVEESHPEWLDKPLNLFYINTSHNTYLSSYQNLSMTTYSSIENALKLGAKCIELDVHYKDNKLLVTHGNVNIQTTNSLEFDKCLDVINNYGFNNSDPIILCLELFVTDPIGQQLLKSTLINKFTTKLLNADYKTNKVAFHDNFRNLLNKVIVIVIAVVGYYELGSNFCFETFLLSYFSDTISSESLLKYKVVLNAQANKHKGLIFASEYEIYFHSSFYNINQKQL